MQSINIPRNTTLAATSPTATEASQQPPRPWLQDTWLWILLVGPLVAPFFVVLGLPILKPFADAIYLIGETVCPKVDVHMMFLGEPVAVCYSCWASVFGLWTIRLIYGRAGEGLGPFQGLRLAKLWAHWERASLITKVGVLSLGFMPWALDVMLWDTGAWNSPSIYMMFAGFVGGMSAGSILLPAASAMRARLASSKNS